MPTKKQKAAFFYISPPYILVDKFTIVAVVKIDMMSIKMSEAIVESPKTDGRYTRRLEN